MRFMGPSSMTSSAPRSSIPSAIVDQNMETISPLGRPGGRPLELLHSGKVGRDGNTSAGLRKLFCKRLASVGAAGGDIDFGAVFDVSTGDHFAQATPSAGHQRDLSANREQLFDFHASLLMNWKYV